MSESPHRCPICSQQMVLLRTFNLKLCVDCFKEFPWTEPDEQPLSCVTPDKGNLNEN